MQQEQMRFPVGAIIRGDHGDRYLVEDLLGQGGFSAVYLVRNLGMKRGVFALKEVINPDMHERTQFAFEAEILKRLQHKSLPHIYQVFENVRLKRIYLLMDYIDGKDFEVLRLQHPEQRFSLPLVLTLLAPVVDAVRYLHSQNPPVVHRDIKPANIIVPMHAGDALLVDFGLAKEYVKDKTTNAFRYGSHGYAAPEQYGQGTSPRTDIYALGATFYTLLTGCIPIDALTRSVSNIGKDPLMSVNQLFPTIPAPVSRVIEQAMSLNSADRFATVGEFWRELQTAAKQSVSEAVPNLANSEVRPFILTQEDIASITAKNLQRQRNASRSGQQRVLFVMLLLVLLFAFVSIFAIWSSSVEAPVRSAVPITVTTNATVTGSRVATVPLYPPIAASYAGTITDIGVANEKTSMYLTDVQQKKGEISGMFQGLGKLGPFSGTVTKEGSVQFTVSLQAENVTISFNGHIKLGGDLVGEFYLLNQNGERTGEYGIWNASSTQ